MENTAVGIFLNNNLFGIFGGKFLSCFIVFGILCFRCNENCYLFFGFGYVLLFVVFASCKRKFLSFVPDAEGIPDLFCSIDISRDYYFVNPQTISNILSRVS